MIAHFYLMSESFTKNDQFTQEDIEKKVKSLSEDVILINNYKLTNKLYSNYNDLFPVLFYKTFTVQDFICSPQVLKDEGIDRDIINSLQKIFDKSTETQITSDEVISELLNWNDEHNCHGLIAFNKVEKLNENFQIIYGLNGWYKFRRYFLGIYPKNDSFFFEECGKYFPNLFFHANNKKTLSSILHNCPKKIIYHLTALNDNFRDSQTDFRNRTQVLEHFSITNNLDETASLEGDAKRKRALTFNFTNSIDELEQVCCEPHLKLCFNDLHPGDNSYSTDRRIYFHEGKRNIENGRILVGHIGAHL
jgi:hypothetical protein